tara:strand:- start:228 stop:461 length:234 start_codon:yes stop_codon:yes gene_type:complete
MSGKKENTFVKFVKDFLGISPKHSSSHISSQKEHTQDTSFLRKTLFFFVGIAIISMTFRGVVKRMKDSEDCYNENKS